LDKAIRARRCQLRRVDRSRDARILKNISGKSALALDSDSMAAISAYCCK
jgi:hypothetical protein